MRAKELTDGSSACTCDSKWVTCSLRGSVELIDTMPTQGVVRGTRWSVVKSI